MAPNPQELEKPTGSVGKPEEVVIHVIPKEFYGGVVPARRATAAAPAAAPPPPSAPKKGGGLAIVITLLLIVLLGGGGAGAYFFLLKKKPVVKAPPAPVCGNSQCETGETYSTCPKDCPPPPPVCGDGKCETGENRDNCPSDCQPPAPVCGNGQCEDGESSATCPTDCPPPVPVAGQDTDSDGLTDMEETQIYGTDPRDVDSDHDGFIDLNEVLNLYNPAVPTGKTGDKLIQNPGLTTYENDVQKYSLYRPTSWTVREVGDTKSEVDFTAADGESVQVKVQPKDEKLSIMDWYLSQATGIKSSEVTLFKTKRAGQEALQSPDKLTSYVDVGNRVIVLHYNLAKDNLMQFRATFLMMVTSVEAQKVAQVETEQTPTPTAPVVPPVVAPPVAPPATTAAPATPTAPAPAVPTVPAPAAPPPVAPPATAGGT